MCKDPYSEAIPSASIIISIQGVADRREAIVDGGATINTIIQAAIPTQPIDPTETVFMVATGTHIHPIGEIILNVAWEGVERAVKFIVLESAASPIILGTRWAADVGAVTHYDDKERKMKCIRGAKAVRQLADSLAEMEQKEKTIGAAHEEITTEKSAEEETPFSINPTVETVETTTIMPLIVARMTIVPPESLRFVKMKKTEPATFKRNGWLVERAYSADPDKQWVIPNCLVDDNDPDYLHVPVLNPSTKPVRLYGGEEVAEVSRFMETEGIIETQENELEDEEIPRRIEEVVEQTAILYQPTLRRFLHRYKHLFYQKNLGLKCAANVEHHIETRDARPIRSSPRPVTPLEREYIREVVDTLIADDIAEPSNSPWGCTVVLAPKKDGTLRFCCDYRRLNAITVRDVYPIPRADDVINHLGGSTIFTSLDLKNGYWQIPLTRDSREKTAFVTPDGLFQYKRLPFGLSNGTATFQRAVDRALGGLKWTMCVAFLDDLVVYGKDFDEHMSRLEKVFEALDKANFTLNIAKCHFAVDKIECLGFFISRSGVHADPKKVQAIVDFPSPDLQPAKSRISALRSFIGAASFYRRFISQFAEIVAPLHQLLKKNAIWKWDQEQEAAFQQLKDAMVKAPVLALPCEGGEFILQTEASTLGLGAVLIQKLNGESHPVTYISRRLDPAESNYKPDELACLAVVWALDKLRYYLYGRKFVVKTGSNTFKWLKERKKLKGKFSTWIMEIQDYDFVVEHTKGTESRVTEAIANNPVDQTKVEEVPRQVCILRSIGYSTQELALLQQGDKTICAPLLRLQCLGVEEPKGQDDGVFRLSKGVLYKINPASQGKKFLLVIPSSLRREIIQSCHDSPTGGHFGVEKTRAKVAERYWWPGLTTSIKTYVAACHFCQLNKRPTGLTEGMLQPIQPPSRPMQQYGMDYVGPFKRTVQGNRHILAAIDLFSKYVIAKAMPDTTASGAIKFVHEELIGHHGFPKKIITDRGTAFTAKAFAKALEDWGIRHTMSSTAHPQSNGQVERNHRNLITALKAFVNPAQNNWDEKVTDAVVAINSSKQSSTEVSPYEIVYGQTMELPHERLFPWPTTEETSEDQKARSERIDILRASTRQKLLLKQSKMKTRVDKHRRKPKEYSPGDLILVTRNIRKIGRTKKLLPKYVGPFQIVAKQSPLSYLVEDIKAKRKKKVWRRFPVHVSQIKPYKTPRDEEYETQQDQQADETTTAVKRTRSGRRVKPVDRWRPP